ncbi:MAG: hypothetical protein PHS41_06705 [Victivallaceae bacterium]|nr:hypothetical protein [Victivallaceae bacterium]
MPKNDKTAFRHGFFCVLFWLLTWAGILGGIVALCIAFRGTVAAAIWGLECFLAAGIFAGLSYLFRTIDKNRFEGKFSWHWND